MTPPNTTPLNEEDTVKMKNAILANIPENVREGAEIILTNLIQTLEKKAEQKVHEAYINQANKVKKELGNEHLISTDSIIYFANTSIEELSTTTRSTE